MKIFKMIRGFFLKWSRSSNDAKSNISCQTEGDPNYNAIKLHVDDNARHSAMEMC